MNNKKQSLYEALNMKAKNSIYKSVFLTNEKTHDNCHLVEVEPYDKTFINAISSVSKYDKTLDKIMKKIYNFYNQEEVNLVIYTDEYGHQEILLSEYYMKEVAKLI